MKKLDHFKRIHVLLAIAAIFGFSGDSVGQTVNTVFWNVPDPFTEAYGGAGGESGQSNITLVDASTLSFTGITDADANGDPRGQIGQVIFDPVGTQQPNGDNYNRFTNIGVSFNFGTGPGEIDPAFIGTPFLLEVDYFVPQNPDSSAIAFDSDDFIYHQINTNGTNTGDGNSAGFVNGGSFSPGWNTMSLEYTIQATVGGSATTDMTAFLISLDGGFGGGGENGDGVTPHMYFDNLRLIGNYDETQPIPDPSIPGDFNNDMMVNIADIDAYTAVLGQASAGNEDFDFVTTGASAGVIDLEDLTFHVENYVMTSNGETGTFLGDLNLDGEVNVFGDGLTFIAALGNPATSYAQGDLNLSGNVDVFGDGLTFIANLGSSNAPPSSPSSSAVPEPGSLSLLVLAGLGAVARRRR